MLGQQPAAVFKRILAGCRGQFVGEAFTEEIILRIADRAPEPDSDDRLVTRPLDLHVGAVVRPILEAFDRRLVHAVLERETGRLKDRWTRDAGRVSDGTGRVVERGTEVHLRGRTIEVPL